MSSQIHNRQSFRLKGYDYSQEGLYFITICVQDRKCLFGQITDREMVLNDVGKIAYQYLNEIPKHYPNVEIGEFIVMPNHVHCVLVLHNVHTRHNVGTRHGVSLPDNMDNTVGTCHGMSPQQPTIPQPNINQFGKPIANSVSVIINQYKSSVKRWCNKKDYAYFKWQSRFHDHIIRNQQSYQIISDYIINNPLIWEKDKFYLK